MVSLISAYWLVSTGRLPGTSRVYQTLNVIGAAGLLANTFYYRAYPAAALNLTWLCIGVIAICAGGASGLGAAVATARRSA